MNLLRPIKMLPLACMLLMALLLGSCRSAYNTLQPATGSNAGCIQKFKPLFIRTLYTAQVDVTNHHLSGLLLIKQMPDSSIRLVFTMEAGFKFFDFEFSRQGDFTVHYIMDKMNKKAVIKTLRKDFEMMLMQNIELQPAQDFTANSLLYHRIKRTDSYDYYITDSACTKLVRAEKTGGKKTIVMMQMENYQEGIPEIIRINHQNFTFNINLTKLDRVQDQ